MSRKLAGVFAVRCLVIVLVSCVCLTVGVASAPATVVHSSDGSITAGPSKTLGVFLFTPGVNGTGEYVYVAEQASTTGNATLYRFTEALAYASLTFAGTEAPSGGVNLVSSGLAMSGLAVDNSSTGHPGSVYAADPKHKVVDRFSEEGVWECQITAKKPVSSEEIAHECDGATGSKPTENEGFEPVGVAVGATGDVYVSDATHKAIDEFGPGGEFIAQITNAAITAPRSIAVNPAGDIYVVNGGTFAAAGTNVVEDAAGTFSTFESNEPTSVAADPNTGHVYAYDNNTSNHRVDEYSSTGALIDTFAEHGSNIRGFLAVSPKSGKVFLAKTSELDAFSADIVIPTVKALPATSVEETTATLHGEVEPDTADGGTEVASCKFEYVTAKQYEEHSSNHFEGAQTIVCAPATPYTSARSVSASPTLVAHTQYYYRVAAVNADAPSQTSYSTGETFQTKGAPAVETVADSGVTRTTATLEAKVNPEGYDTHYEFQYGETDAYGHSIPVPAADLGEGQTAVSVSQTLTGLKDGVTYHYRVVARNSHGTAESSDHEFTTVPVAAVEYKDAFGGPDTATIQASVNPSDGLAPLADETSCEVQYVSEAEYAIDRYANAKSVACDPASIPAADGATNVIAHLSGLSVSTVYHYRFVVANEAGREARGESSFATFGLEVFSIALSGEGGGAFTQAGGHPYEMVTELVLHRSLFTDGFEPDSGELKDAIVQLPPGLIGNPDAASKCTRRNDELDRCPPSSQIGEFGLSLAENEGHGKIHVEEIPLFNLTPPTGVAAEFGSQPVNGQAVALIEAKVRSGSDYGIETASLNIPTIGGSGVVGVKVVIWGVPNEASHNPGRVCFKKTTEEVITYTFGCGPEGAVRPFLSDPTACAGALSGSAEVDSYSLPGRWSGETEMVSSGMTGCATVPFDPSLAVSATTAAADSPTGLNLDIHVPQNEEPAGQSTSDLKDATVTLPAGLVVNPSSASGLESCSEQQVGFKREFAELDPASEPGVKTPQFTPGAAECPNGSKLGSVIIHTPLLEHPIEGGMYLATPHENPFGSLIALYLAVHDPVSGVVIKLPGKVEANPVTGQLTAVFDQNPQLPFEDLEVNLFNSPRASLTTPLTCGAYSASSALAPWSGNPAATPSSDPPLHILEAPGGGACASSEGATPNKPSFEAGTASPIAGAYSPFVLKLSREDGSQRFSALNVTLPPGLLGKVAGIEQCSQADIEAAQRRSHEGEGALEQSSPSCPSGSKVGVVHVGAGSGAPYYVTGQAYFAGPYEGAPFSLVIVTPAIAGPFDLGTVVVRAGLYINPSTAQVTVKSDPFPTILDGIPLDIRTIGVEMNRSDFTLNPTSCETMAIAGEETSTTSQTAGLSSRFKAEGCTSLPFHPSFTASTQGSTSKADGASLKVNVGSAGVGQADIAKVQLTIPKVMPARLTTLQQACTEAQFNANPAGCPAASNIGSAIVHTPILASPLAGPAYIVSHGGAAFPDVEMVLQGEGVTLVLDGHTDIKGGVTYSKFETVPDAPFTSFEFNAPEGPYSIFTTENPGKTNLCATSTTKTVTVKEKVKVKIKHGGHKTVTRKVKKTEKVAQSLTIPTTIVGQNGATITQETQVAVTGCPKAASVKKAGKKKQRQAQKHHKKGGGKKKR